MGSVAVRRVWTWGLPLVAVVSCALLLLAMLGVGKAKAAPSAPAFLGEITEAEVPAEGESNGLEPRGLATDPSNGDLYVADHFGFRVVKLSPYGVFILSFGKEVNRTKVELVKAKEAKSEAPTPTELEEENICTAASGNDCSPTGGYGGAGGSFRNASGVAVEAASGAVYVQDTGNQRVEKFSSTGHFLLAFGLDVNKVKAEAVEAEEANSETPTATELKQANLCVAGEECQAGKTGSSEGAFESWSSSSRDVAVGDPAGKELVYVGDKARIEAFEPNGEFKEALSISSLSATAKVTAIAADASGDVFFFDEGVAGVHMAETNAGGALALSSTVFDAASTGVQALALDGAGGLYVADESPSFRVLAYEAGKPSEAPAEFAGSEPGQLSEARALAADADAVYAGDASKIDFYGSLTAMEGQYGAPPMTAPAIGSEVVRAGVEETTATVEAEIDPELRETHYQVEYGLEPCGSGGCTKVPSSPGSLPTVAKTAHQLLVPLTGLQVGPVYHYRLTVENVAGKFEGSEQVFRIGRSSLVAPAALPDGRVYEEVSPANKLGNQIRPAQAFVAADGQAVMYSATGAVVENASSGTVDPWFVSERTSHGWVTRSTVPLPPVGKTKEEEYVQISALPTVLVPSADLSRLLFGTWGNLPYVGSPDERNLNNNLFLEGPDPLAEPEWVGRSQIDGSPGGVNPNGSLTVAGASPDLDTIYFLYEGELLPKASGLYEYREGVLSDAGVLPGGEASTGLAVPAAQPEHGGLHITSPAARDGEVSADGSRIFFVRQDEAGALELYARVTASGGSQSTVLISRSQLPGHAGEPAPNGPLAVPSTVGISGGITPEHGLEEGPPSYVFASSDGLHAFFQSTDRLTEDAPENVAAKTYEFDLATEALEYLPALTGSIVTVSNDASSLLFENTATTPIQLERWTAGPGGGNATPIAQLPPVSPNACEAVVCVGPAYTSSDGNVVVFATESPIAGFNDGGGHYPLSEAEAGEEPVTGGGLLPNIEVFRYDAEAGELSCVSCPAKGVAPSGDATMSNLALYADVPSETATHEVITPGQAMSADGGEVFFETRQALVPQDTNGTSDVYEWENGTIHLISSGHSPQPSYFNGISESGADAFITTAEGIASGDTDGSQDVYDARIPRPGDNPPPEAVPCVGAVCQGPPSVPDLLGQPASEAFNGPGNLTPRKQSAKSKTKKLTRKQRQRRAVNACKHRFRHSRHERRACVRRNRHHNGRGK
ncbi:MAG TPA: hypothetical protein VGF95_07680 [Solirubrobacteraceae bacterium]